MAVNTESTMGYTRLRKFLTTGALQAPNFKRSEPKPFLGAQGTIFRGQSARLGRLGKTGWDK